MVDKFVAAPLFYKLVAIAGLTVVVTLVCYVAVAYDLSLLFCVFIIGIIVMAVLLFYVLRWWRNHQRGRRLEQELLNTQIEPGHEVAQLRIKLKSAINALKTSMLGVGYRGSAALYALPWYMVIGPSAAGKTTLLRSSGLNFPLASAEDIRVTGFGGTRNCDWWFSDQAIILDTAGRYTTEVNDKEEWLGFLKILKKHRRKSPINGVIVALGLSEILTSDQKNLQWHAHLIRERIEELATNLGFILPISIVFTKCDLLQGFNSFFQQYSSEQCDQVWGVNLDDVKRPEIMEQFNQRLDNLYEQLSQLRLDYLQTQQTISHKHQLYDFPIQFQQASKRIKQFVQLIMQDNPYHNEFNLSGLYFTSGCQEGIQVEYSIDDENKFTKNKKTLDVGDKSYFIKNLLSNVVFYNQQQLKHNKKLAFLTRFFKIAYITIMGLVLLIVIIMWSAVYSRNSREYLNSIALANNLVLEYQAPSTVVPLLLSEQLSVYQQYNLFKNHAQVTSWSQRLGLFSGEPLIEPLDIILNKTLSKSFMPIVTKSLTIQLQDYIDSWATLTEQQKKNSYADYYQTLRDYMFLALQANGSTLADANFIAHIWLATLFSNDHKTIDSSQLSGLVNYYLQGDRFPAGISWKPDEQLIDQARSQLNRPQNISDIYQNVKQNLALQMGNLKISDLYNGSGASLFEDKYLLSKMFTKQAWQETVQPALVNAANNASRGDWVIVSQLNFNLLNKSKLAIPLGDIKPELAKQLLRQLQATYFSDYAANWLGWLQAFTIHQFVSLADADNGIATLTKFNSPLLHMFDAIAENFNFSDEIEVAGSMTELYQLLSSVNNRRQYLAAIKSVRQDLDSLKSSSNASAVAKDFATQILLSNNSASQLYLAQDKIAQITAELSSNQLVAGINYALTSPLRAVWLAILTQAAIGIQQQWQQQVLPSYAAVLATRYPFSRTGADADYVSVQQFFDPQQGVLWKFVSQQLGTFLQIENVHWQPRTWLSVGMPFTTEFMQKLQQAQDISTLIFSNDGKFSYAIYPIPEPTLSQVKLTSNGVVYSYHNGPQLWTNKTWNAKVEHPFSQLLIERNDHESQASIDGSGLWGLFKIFQQAQISKQQSGYLLAWQVTFSDGRRQTVSLLFKTNSPVSAIDAFVTQSFTLPKDIIKKEY